MNTKVFLLHCKQEGAEELLGYTEERDAGGRITKVLNLPHYEK